MGIIRNRAVGSSQHRNGQTQCVCHRGIDLPPSDECSAHPELALDETASEIRRLVRAWRATGGLPADPAKFESALRQRHGFILSAADSAEAAHGKAGSF